MNFLRSLRSDLLSRPLLPLVALACAGLIAAIAYSVSAGGSSPSPSETVPPVIAASSASHSALGSAREAQANPNQAASETTSGTSYQNQGKARNPFQKLPEAKTAASSTSKSAETSNASGSSKTKSSGSGTSTSNAGGTTPTKPKETTPPAKPKKAAVHYNVSLQFGVVPPTPEGSAPQAPQLKTYTNLKRLAPLPSQSNSLLVFNGVSSSGKGVILTMVHPAIIKGQAVCLPSTSQCETLDMAVGTTEELEYLQPTGETVIYQLKVLSITKSNQNASTASYLNGQVSKAGQRLLMSAEPPVLRKLRFSRSKGVLFYFPHR